MIYMAICEDQKEDSAELALLIERYMSQRCLKYKLDFFENGESLLKAFVPAKYTLVFLDIILPGISGMDTAKKLRTLDPDLFLVFTTVTSDYALAGYRVQAADYLLKPLTYESLIETLRHCKLLSRPHDAVISITSDQNPMELCVSDILYAEVFGNYLLIHTRNAVFKTYLALSTFATLLPANAFLRISRSHLINMQAILELERNTVLLSSGEKFSISRGRKKQVSQCFNHYLLKKARSD